MEMVKSVREINEVVLQIYFALDHYLESEF